MILSNNQFVLRKSISSGGRTVKIAFKEVSFVTSLPAENFVELELVNGAQKVADHVSIAANVEDGCNIQVEFRIPGHRWSNAYKFKPEPNLFQILGLLLGIYRYYFSAQYSSLSCSIGMSSLNIFQRQIS